MDDFESPNAELYRDTANRRGSPRDRRQHRRDLFEIADRFGRMAAYAETRGE